MTTYIVLLRGVMPTGRNKVPMEKLREVLKADGFQNVRTYIASGNALVDTTLTPKALEQRVHDLIKEHIGPDLAVIVRIGDQLQTVLDENPFTDAEHDPSRLFFGSFAETPEAQKVAALTAQDYAPEKLAITEHAAYLYIPGTYGREKLSGAYLEKKLGIAVTMRNLNTMRKLIAMSKA